MLVWFMLFLCIAVYTYGVHVHFMLLCFIETDKIFEYDDLGDRIYECVWCGASFWLNESLKTRPKNRPPTFTLCCQKGKIVLPFSPSTPLFLENLLNPLNGRSSTLFRLNFRGYNAMMAFSSIGANIHSSINDGSAPYVFKISGQIHHLMGSLLPLLNHTPKFSQLYVHDTQHEVDNRLNALCGQEVSDVGDFDKNVINGLISMLDDCNELVKLFRMVRDKFENSSVPSFKLRILEQRDNDRRFSLPTSDEIGCLIVGDIGEPGVNKDIIIETQNGNLFRVEKLHPKFMSLQYPLLFPHGEDGYRLNIPLQNVPPNQKDDKTVTMLSFYAYQIQDRRSTNVTVLKGGRLFQQYVVDAYVVVEHERLEFMRNNQEDLRSDVYQGVHDALSRREHTGENIGQKVILPSSFTGSPRYMINNYHDAMTICRRYGNPDLFITFTCNVKWPEILRDLQNIPGYKAEDRPDLVVRVFNQKLKSLISYVKSGVPFGKVDAHVSTIEFQKRGLPHSHMLFWLQKKNKCYTATDIDSIISAEIPDKLVDPKLYDIVGQFMVHGPCGISNRKSPCMIDGKCSKFFPKSFNFATTFGSDSSPMYRRRDDPSVFIEKNGFRFDNRHVVPYNAELLKKFNAHINMECCSHSMLIKYLFKYITKGPDRARVIFQENDDDEIQTFLNCRYLASQEAMWRLFHYPIHVREPAVMRLCVHLPLENNICFHRRQSLHSIRDNELFSKTMLTEWFTANRIYPTAIKYTYAEFPLEFVWITNDRIWQPRKREGFSLGRLSYVHPTAGELYFLRMLLHIQKGCTSYESIRTVNRVLHPTYQDACRALLLLGDDREWNDALNDAAHTATSSQMRTLFVAMLKFCEMGNPAKLFNDHWLHMSEDIRYKAQSENLNSGFILSDVYMRNELLFELDHMLQRSSSSLRHYHLPLPNPNEMIDLGNRCCVKS